MGIVLICKEGELTSVSTVTNTYTPSPTSYGGSEPTPESWDSNIAAVQPGYAGGEWKCR